MSFLRRGCLLALGLALAAIAAIAVLVARPVRVVGLSGEPLARSLDSKLEASHDGACEEIEGGRREETVWRCVLRPEDELPGPEAAPTFTLEVSEWGCWEAQGSAPGAGGRLEDCVWLADYADLFD